MFPQRIVSLLASSTEMLFGLGLGERVVGISHECDFPSEALSLPRLTRTRVAAERSSREIDQQVREQVAAREPLYELDESLLASLRPELIVTQAQCDVCAVRYEDVCAAAKRLPGLGDCPVVALNPQRFADLFDDIRRVAQAAGVAPAAESYVEALQRRIQRVQQAVAPVAREQRPRVVCLEWLDPLMVAANWMPELVELAGGRYDLAEAGVHSSYSDWQRIAQYNPEVLLLMPCGFDLRRAWDEREVVSQQPGWTNLNAVRTGRVWVLDGNAYFNRSGPRLIDSLEIVAHLLHPQLVPKPAGLTQPGAVCRQWRA